MRTRALVLFIVVVLCGCAGTEERVLSFDDRDAPLAQWPADRLDTHVLVRVVDVGAGLCVIGRVPGDRYFVYDGGNYDNERCGAAADALVGDRELELMVISHGDSDHLGNVPELIGERGVRVIAWTGDLRTVNTWQESRNAIGKAATNGASVVSMLTWPRMPGQSFEIGDATVTLIAGWGGSPWNDLDESDRNNAISIVARLDYGDSSILLTGDTIGRHRDDDNSEAVCARAEKVMVDRAAEFPLSADVLLAPHHGANNGSSTCFIRAVEPSAVIFAAGHKHRHPRALTVERYMAEGLTESDLYRTDRGDNEGGNEWKGTLACGDATGDDDIEVQLPRAGSVTVRYVFKDECE